MRSLLLISLTVIVTSCTFGQTEGYADCRSVKLHYTVFGKGYPLVIINGGPGMNSEGFAGVARQLSVNNGNQVIIYDQRGTGRSKMDRIDQQTGMS